MTTLPPSAGPEEVNIGPKATNNTVAISSSDPNRWIILSPSFAALADEAGDEILNAPVDTRGQQTALRIHAVVRSATAHADALVVVTDDGGITIAYTDDATKRQ